MADAQDSGTPPGAADTDPAQGGGTTSEGQDGREPNAKPVDAALALAWKEKAERYNALDAEREELRRRLEEAERRAYGQQQQDPRVQQLAELQQRAAYDPDAQRELALWQMQAQALAENQLTQALYAEAVPPKLAGRVADIVRQSGYRTTVAEALAMVSPPENPEVASRLKSMQEQLEKAQAELAAARKRQASAGPAWAGGGGGGGGAPPGAPTMTASEYAAALAEGGKRAADVRADMAANRLRLVPG